MRSLSIAIRKSPTRTSEAVAGLGVNTSSMQMPCDGRCIALNFSESLIFVRTSPVFPSSSSEPPEIDQRTLDRLVHHCRVLGVPAQRDADSSRVARGRELFASLGCTSCHVPTLTTGIASPIALFRGVTIHPYTDLLLHDMGPRLADDRIEGQASGREWRTPPLWGIGLIETVNGHTRFLHDGRARSLEEAVLWHGCEAEASRAAFMALPREQRQALIRFLESL